MGGSMEAGRGHYVRAVRLYRRVLDLTPDREDLLEHIGELGSGTASSPRPSTRTASSRRGIPRTRGGRRGSGAAGAPNAYACRSRPVRSPFTHRTAATHSAEVVGNLDSKTVEGFGDEWARFDQSGVSGAEMASIFDQYFRIFPWAQLPPDAVGFDLGCGSGRWARRVAPRVGRLHCIDASADALAVASGTSPRS